VHLLLALPPEKNTWDAAVSFGDSVRKEYWKNAHVFWKSEDSEATEYGIQQLVEAGRAREAVDFIAGSQRMASDSEELTASLKRCPDTKREFSSRLESRTQNNSVIAAVNRCATQNQMVYRLFRHNVAGM